jgi:L-lactate dehydrogenase complex protein LldE
MFYPQVGKSTLGLLEKLGVQVDYPTDQTCCGQPMANSGAHAEAKATEELLVRNFADFDYVVAPSGSCVHHIRNKFTAADDTPERRHVSTHVWDLPEFPRDVLEVDSFRGPGLTTRSHSTSVARQSAGWGSSQ